jgi:hypothetical protein
MSTLPENDDWETTGPPWKEPGGCRRDCHPERGDLLQWLVAAELFPSLAVLSFGPLLAIFWAQILVEEVFHPGTPKRGPEDLAMTCGGLALLSLLGLIGSLVVWRLAQNDLREMEVGERDPAGIPKTLSARNVARVTTVFDGCFLVFAAIGFAYCVFGFD